MTHPTISRKDAIGYGHKHYFTGRPCERGHVSERYTSNAACLACLRRVADERHANLRARRALVLEDCAVVSARIPESHAHAFRLAGVILSDPTRAAGLQTIILAMRQEADDARAQEIPTTFLKPAGRIDRTG
jgi:hypothetical protein